MNQAFWKNFAKNTWEKKPLALKGFRSGPSEITADEIFELLVLYADRCRKLGDPEGFKFYIDGYKTGADDVLRLLPLKKDKTLLGYHERMNALFEDYCLVCDELLQVSAKHQQRLTEFTDELYRHVGFPNRFTEIGLYLGNYRKTPFGVHVDACGVFSFPVVGKKRFRLWTSEFVAKHPALDRAFKYDKYKKNSQLLEAGPGDMTYWPSSAYHIAESNGSFSATWSLGVWVDRPHVDMLTQTLKAVVAQKLGAAGASAMTPFESLYGSNGEVTDLPPVFADSIEHLKNLDASELHEVIAKTWMQHISSRGFKNAPGSELKLSLSSQIRLRNPQSPVLWRSSGGENSFSFAGQLVTGSSALLKLIKAVNAGRTCRVDSFLTGSSSRRDLKSLQTLAAASAFVKPSSRAK